MRAPKQFKKKYVQTFGWHFRFLFKTDFSFIKDILIGWDIAIKPKAANN